MHIPFRTCIACKNKLSKDSLIRLSKSVDDNILINSKNGFGKSCYVCKNKKCIDIVVKKKILDRKFKLTIPEDLYESLTNQL